MDREKQPSERQGPNRAYCALLARESHSNELMAEILSRASHEFKASADMFRPELWFSPENPPLSEAPSLSSAIVSFEAACLRLKATSVALAKAIPPHTATYTHTHTHTQTQNTQRKRRKTTGTTSEHFDPFTMKPTPSGLNFRLSPSKFGLIQERIRNSLWALVVQTVLWNKTTARVGRPVLFKLLSKYQTPSDMASADVNDVMCIVRCLGLQNKRSKLLIDLARQWLSAPPDPSRRYTRRHYPKTGDNLDLKDGAMVEEEDLHPSFEISHLPGVGPYAIDSYRIFYRDTLRKFGVDPHEVFEPEWKRVLPQDKDLRAYLKWRWRSVGWDWDEKSGERRRIVQDTGTTRVQE